MRKNSIKNTRINEEVMRELAKIIREEIKDPRIHPMTSIASVEVGTMKSVPSITDKVQFFTDRKSTRLNSSHT